MPDATNSPQTTPPTAAPSASSSAESTASANASANVALAAMQNASPLTASPAAAHSRGKHLSISIKLPLMIVICGLIIAVVFTTLVYYKYEKRMYAQYLHTARGITKLMALELDGDRIDEYIEKGYELDEYKTIQQRFAELRDCTPDILYLYVFRMTPEGGIVVMDLDSVDGLEDALQPGDFYEFSPKFMSYMDRLLVGAVEEGMEGPTEDGYILTYCQPVYDSNGVIQCHACVDFSIDELRQEDAEFVLTTILVGGLAALIIVFASIHWIRKRVTTPLNQMAHATEEFHYQTHEDHARNIEIMESLNIRTHDEIERVYRIFIAVMKQNLMFMESLSKAQNALRSKDEQIGQISLKAFRDALTCVGNKAAFNGQAKELNLAIRDKKAKFAIVMLDANNLKQINDEYGHECGDLYLQNCCRIICDVYRKSPVFRLGGDEFVVLLMNHDYEYREDLFDRINEIFETLQQMQQKKPWERCSMSAGMAEYNIGDNSIDQVLKRADAAMYSNKDRFKKEHGSYR